MQQRNFQMPGRSPVYATNAMAASSHPLATQTALDTLRKGGNAVDAAIAASAVLAVVEPHMTGIGGDCFAFLKRMGEPLVAINGSGRAPKGATAAPLIKKGLSEVPANSVHAITIPGSIDAWHSLLQSHGTMGFDALFRPAIRYATEGYPVAPRVAHDWPKSMEFLAKDEGASEIYLKDGAAPEVGTIMFNPKLAKTLNRIAQNGRDEFYTGKTAEQMVSHLRSIGGKHQLDDFANHKSEWVEPLFSNYRGKRVAQIPPNAHGATVQVILNILEQFDLKDLDPLSAQRIHLEIEAARLGYQVRDSFIADPQSMTVDANDLIDKAYAEKLKTFIDPAKRTESLALAPSPVGSDTVYLTVVDANWTAISFINSIYTDFGSRIAHPDLGLLYHSRGNCFNLTEGHPNCLEGGKRPMHTIIPGMAFDGEDPILSFGVMGGAYQPFGQAHVLSNVIDYGMDIQQAIDHPRVFWDGDRIGYECGIPDETRSNLAAMGHDVYLSEKAWGGGQGIQLDWKRGVLIGGSDPRKDGCAAGF